MLANFLPLLNHEIFWKLNNCWHRSETKLTNNKFFGVIYRFKHVEAVSWGERTYGLANLCVDLDLHDRYALASTPAVAAPKTPR